MTVYSDGAEIIVVNPVLTASIIRGLFSPFHSVQQVVERYVLRSNLSDVTETATVVEITKIVFPSK
jgi:hypothetical protein